MEQHGVPNAILEMDLTGFLESNFAGDDATDNIMEMLTFLLGWHKNKFPKGMTFLNLRDLPAAMYKNTEFALGVVRRLAKLEKNLRPNGIMFEEPSNVALPTELAQWVSMVRKEMDTNCWSTRVPEPDADGQPDGLLQVHVHNNWGLGEACQLACLSAGATGIWCSICEEGGAAEGHACSAVTLANLARIGNDDVGKRYRTHKLASAAQTVTYCTTGKDPHDRQVVYGPRSGEALMAMATPACQDANFDLLALTGRQKNTSVNELSKVLHIVEALQRYFGDNAEFSEENSRRMLKQILADLNSGNKEEYSSEMGLAKLFVTATKKRPACIWNKLQKLSELQDQDPFVETMVCQAHKHYNQTLVGSEGLDFNAWLSVFGTRFFGRQARASEAAMMAFKFMDLNGNGTVEWWEIKLFVEWACKQYHHDIMNFDDLVVCVLERAILPNIKETLESSEKVMNFMESWMKVFNNGAAFAEKLAQTYREDAVVHVDLRGTETIMCRGREQIKRFWQKFMQKGQVVGFQPESHAVCIKDSSLILEFAGGIHGCQARYMLYDAGEWKIAADHLKLDLSKENLYGHDETAFRTASQQQYSMFPSSEEPQIQICDSLKEATESFKTAFNAQDHEKCASVYAKGSVMVVNGQGITAATNLQDKDEIKDFWKSMIHEKQLRGMQGFESNHDDNGMTICLLGKNTALVKSKWRMNIASGHISQLMRRDARSWLVHMQVLSIYAGEMPHCTTPPDTQRSRSVRRLSPHRRYPRSRRSPGSRSPGSRSPRSRSPRRRSPRRRSPRRQSPRRQSPRRQSPRRQSPRRESPRRQYPRRQPPRRQSPLGHSPQRRSPHRSFSPSPHSPSPQRRTPHRGDALDDFPFMQIQ